MKKLFWLFSICLLLVAPRQAVAVPVIGANGIVNNASFAPGSNALAPGTLAAIFGTGLNDGSQNPFSSFVNGKLVTTLGGASVTFNGISAPMFSSFPTQLNVQVPLELTGATSAQVIVTVGGVPSAPATVSIGTTSPGIFAVGNGQGAILIANTSIFAASSGSIPGAQSRAANPGEFITIFTTGMGAVNNPPATGAAASGQTTTATPQVTIGGAQATVSFSGMAPDFVALYQVNVQVPTGVGNSFVPVVMSIGGKQSNVVNIAVSGNNSGGGSFCSGFSLSGTATSLTGTIPGNCLSNLERGSTVTGGVPVSLTGVVNGNNQTVYSGNLTGNGTGQCATGSTGNWTANISLTITVNPTVPSIATNGGILSGSFNTSGSINFCGSTQIFTGIPASGIITGGVAPGGATTVNIGGPMGLPPLVLRGGAQTVSGPLSGATVTALLANNFSANGSVSISATGSTSGNQTVYTGVGSGTGIVQQCPGGSGTWTANISSFTATVSPTVSSLATNGGTVSGTWSASLSGTVCGSNQSRTLSGAVSGVVSPGGSLTLTLVVNSGGGGGNNNPVILTGTATSISGTVLATQFFDGEPTATGSISVSATGVSSSSQTVYTGSGSGSGTVSCQNFTGSNTIGNWSISVTATITVSPAVPSIATSGGTLSGTAATGFSGTICGMSVSDQGTDPATGTVAPGGAVTLSL